MEHEYEVIRSEDRVTVMRITGTWRRVEKVIYHLNTAGYGVIARRADKAAPVQQELAFA